MAEVYEPEAILHITEALVCGRQLYVSGLGWCWHKMKPNVLNSAFLRVILISQPFFSGTKQLLVMISTEND